MERREVGFWCSEKGHFVTAEATKHQLGLGVEAWKMREECDCGTRHVTQ